MGAWLDWVYQQEPLLSDFSPVGQDDLIARFKELDKLLEVAAQIEVRKRVFERYPNVRPSTGGKKRMGANVETWASSEENFRSGGDRGQFEDYFGQFPDSFRISNRAFS